MEKCTSHHTEKTNLFGKDSQIEFLQKTPLANCDILECFQLFLGPGPLVVEMQRASSIKAPRHLREILYKPRVWQPELARLMARRCWVGLNWGNIKGAS